MLADRETFEQFKKLTHDIQEVFDRHEIPSESQLEVGDAVSEITMLFYHSGVVKGLRMAQQVLKEELVEDDDENYSPNFII